jgi:hypothetical protein
MGLKRQAAIFAKYASYGDWRGVSSGACAY